MFGELKQVIRSPAVRTGLQLMDAHGITAQVLPELLALRGVEQNVFHHLDVHDHTLEVLDQVVAIERDPVAAGFGEHAEAVAELLREPLADELTRGEAMRFAALLHDAAKPWTRIERPGRAASASRATIARARELARDVLRRLRASEKLVDARRRALPAPPAARLPRPRAPAGPARRLALPARDRAVRGRGHRLHGRRPARDARRNAEPAIAAHLELARAAARPRARAPRRGPRARRCVRGDELARELGLRARPRLGELLAQLEEDRFAGAIAHARGRASGGHAELRAG